MFDRLKLTWTDYVRPMMQRPRHLQVAALCYRDGPEGREVLLISSRDTGRWIIPKGWPIPGLDAAGSAMREAWEEAGVVEGETAGEPVGFYCYEKSYDHGFAVPVETLVYPVEVGELTDSFPECEERRRKWVAPAEAAGMVDEPQLRAILREF